MLIDNGLHIDPGYCGYIWIPVHNFTTQPRILPQGQEFISVEFNRTTRLPQYVEGIKSQDELVSLRLRNELRGSEGRAIKVFYKDLDSYRKRNEEFTPRKFWDKFLGETHQSAMLGTEQRLDVVKHDVESTVKTFRDQVDQRIDSLRNFSVVAVAGLIIGILGIILGIALPLLYGEYGKSREVEAQHGADIKDLRDGLLEQKKRLDTIVSNQAAANQSAPTKSTEKERQK